MLTSSAVTYSWNQIFQRLGIQPAENTFRLGKHEIQFAYGDQSFDQRKDFQIRIQACGDHDLDDMAAGRITKLESLAEASFLPGDGIDFPIQKLPILFWGDESAGKFATIKGKTLIMHADILAASFFMLSRYEEAKSEAKDQYGRYPFSASVCSHFNLINYPIVDFYVYVFKYWIEALTGESIRVPHKFRFFCTHDVDFMFHSHPFGKWLGTFLRDLLKLDFSYIKEDFVDLFRNYKDDPYFHDLKYLVDIAKKNGNRDIFYLMASRQSFSREGYSLNDKRVRHVIDYLKKQDVEIGLHASYASFAKPALYAKEKEDLEKALGYPVTTIRQHYLRVRAPQSWHIMESAGLETDESYAFSEHEGFRCGTCFDYKVFDLEQDRELDLIERPLIVMDVSLKTYRKLTLAEAQESILRLAGYCRFVQGNFTLLWHNTSVSRDWHEWGQRLPEIIHELTEMGRSTI
jgi:hypothetical protein